MAHGTERGEFRPCVRTEAEKYMDVRAIFGLSVAFSFIAFGLVTRLFILPRVRTLHRSDALAALIVFHAFRFVGLSFLVPGVAAPSFPSAFAAPAAYGDLATTILAVASVLALIGRASWATGLVWVFNVWGTVDLLYAFYEALFGIPNFDVRAFGATFYLVTVYVPALLITHGLIFSLLLRPRGKTR